MRLYRLQKKDGQLYLGRRVVGGWLARVWSGIPDGSTVWVSVPEPEEIRLHGVSHAVFSVAHTPDGRYADVWQYPDGRRESAGEVLCDAV